MSRSLIRSIAIVIGLASSIAIAGAAMPSSAGAHAAFQDASPEPGARLAEPPRQVALAFTEPLNPELTTAHLVEVHSRRAVPAAVKVLPGRRLLLVPRQRLPQGAYRVDWHTVSVLDGHALEGSFGFGVQTDAVGGEQRLEQSPLARGGWLRAALRWTFYAALFFFAGGVLCGLLLSPGGPPAGWLVPDDVDASRPRERVLGRAWSRTRAAGWIATALGTGVVLAETTDAAGTLSWRAIDAYLLSTVAGVARVCMILTVLLAALLARRARRASAVLILVALGAVAVGGHADSASPRWLALLTDWLHLVAAAVWIGGIAQIVVSWLPGIADVPTAGRRIVMRSVLQRFGRVALPAFGVVVVAGVVNALLELGEPEQLWSTGYGRILLVKIALVAAIALASYTHALRLRPRLLTEAGGWSPTERRHWQLLRTEPLIATAVLVAAALLAASPLPPRQLLERAEAGEEPAPSAAALAPPRPGELSVAEQAGPWMAAAWARRAGGATVGTLRLLNYKVQAVRALVDIAGTRTGACGIGCVTFRIPGHPKALHVRARAGNRSHKATIPISWEPQRTRTARHILRAAIAAVERLQFLRISERLTGGLGGPASISRYRIEGRSRYDIKTRGGGPAETIAIKRHVWVLEPDGSWMSLAHEQPANAWKLLPWWVHRRGIRLLDIRKTSAGRVADIALADLPAQAGQHVPFWFRLRIALSSMRVLRMRMIAPGHFMHQRYFGFDVPIDVRPPRGHR